MPQPKNPWKDFASYESTDARYFKGREESIAKFMRILDSGTMSVLYASSGIGKTSFLQAGIEPLLQNRGYAPIHILFTDDDFAPHMDLGTILGLRIIDEVKKYNNKEKKKAEDNNNYIANTWEWCCLLDQQSEEAVKNLSQHLDTQSLWWKLHAYELRDTNGQCLKPLIIFDQFEEVFVKSKAQRDYLQTLFTTLEELASKNLPTKVEKTLEQLAVQDIFLDLNTQHRYKIIFSLRKEYLSDFDYWTNDRHAIAELHQNRMLLLPLSRTQAIKVITEQPLSLDDNDYYTTLNSLTDNILNVIDDAHRNEIEPFILSVLCSRLYERAVKMGKSELKPEDLTVFSANTIIREFYEQVIHSIIPKRSHLKRFEEELIDDDGKRCRTKVKRLKDIKFEERYREKLVKNHLVRVDSYNGEDYLELVHDRVADAVMERRRESTKRTKIIFARIASFIAILGLFFLTYWMQTFPTSNKSASDFMPYMQYQEATEDYSQRSNITIHNNYTETKIAVKGNVDASNCPKLESIEIDYFYSHVKVRGCKKLKNISFSNDCSSITLDIDDCPELSPILISASVKNLSFSNTPPNNLTFHTADSGQYVWKDKIRTG